MCMTLHEIDRRFAAGSTASAVAKIEWQRVIKIINNYKIDSGNQLVAFIEAEEIEMCCALCAKYGECVACLMPVVDAGKTCNDVGSCYANIIAAINQKDLLLAVNALINKLEEAQERESSEKGLEKIIGVF